MEHRLSDNMPVERRQTGEPLLWATKKTLASCGGMVSRDGG